MEQLLKRIDNKVLCIFIFEQDQEQLVKMYKEITLEVEKGLLVGDRYFAEQQLLKELIK